MGVTECDNMLMLLAVSTKMTEKERDVVIPLIMRGFKDCALEAGTTVTGGQTVMNPWCTIGGVATTICQPNEFIIPDSAVVGDVLVLTKPLGTQVYQIFFLHLMDFYGTVLYIHYSALLYIHVLIGFLSARWL